MGPGPTGFPFPHTKAGTCPTRVWRSDHAPRLMAAATHVASETLIHSERQRLGKAGRPGSPCCHCHTLCLHFSSLYLFLSGTGPRLSVWWVSVSVQSRQKGKLLWNQKQCISYQQFRVSSSGGQLAERPIAICNDTKKVAGIIFCCSPLLSCCGLLHSCLIPFFSGKFFFSECVSGGNGVAPPCAQ